MKKRILAVLFITVVLCLSMTASASAKTIVLKTGSPNMTVDGQQVEIDQGRGTKPVIINGRTLVPIRAIVKEMGGSIAWDGKLRQIVIATENKVIRMHLDSPTAEVKLSGGTVFHQRQLDVAPKSINGRTMVPLRFASEELGAQVGWNAASKQITITFVPANFTYSKWTGAWETNWGIIVLIQNGNTVITAYNSDSLGKITGTGGGTGFAGRWYVDAVENGVISLTMSNGGKTLTGKYEFKEDPTNPKSPVIKYDITGLRT